MIELLSNPYGRLYSNMILVFILSFVISAILIVRDKDGNRYLSKDFTNWAGASILIGFWAYAIAESLIFLFVPSDGLMGFSTGFLYSASNHLRNMPTICVGFLYLLGYSAKATKAEEALKVLSMKDDLFAEEVSRREDSERMLDHYLDVISHEFSNSVSKIVGYAELCKMDIEKILESDNLPELQEELLDNFSYMFESGKMLADMLDGLSEYAQIANHKIFSRENVNTDEIMRSIVNALAPEIQSANGVVRWDSSQMPVIKASSSIMLVFRNLISNAIKYRDPLRSPVVNVSASSENKFWRFTVSDNGLGFNQADEKEIFTIFRSAHEDIAGRKIGLAVSRRIVRANGGDLSATSEGDGNGATFTFTIKK